MWARHVLDMEEAGLETPPGAGDEGRSLLGYSPILAGIHLIADRVMAVRTAVQSTYTKDHVEPSFRWIDPPETALDREREARTRTVLQELDALVLGGGLVVDSVT